MFSRRGAFHMNGAVIHLRLRRNCPLRNNILVRAYRRALTCIIPNFQTMWNNSISFNAWHIWAWKVAVTSFFFSPKSFSTIYSLCWAPKMKTVEFVNVLGCYCHIRVKTIVVSYPDWLRHRSGRLHPFTRPPLLQADIGAPIILYCTVRMTCTDRNLSHT